MQTYSAGTFRCGPLHQISLVGTVHEEVGGYFPDMLALLESSPFLRLVSFNTESPIALIIVGMVN